MSLAPSALARNAFDFNLKSQQIKALKCFGRPNMFLFPLLTTFKGFLLPLPAYKVLGAHPPAPRPLPHPNGGACSSLQTKLNKTYTCKFQINAYDHVQK